MRDLDNPLVADYEKLITEYGSDYCSSNASKFNHTVTAEFFAPFSMSEAEFPNKQEFNWEGFKGRLLSSSYSLREGDNRYLDMLMALELVFNRYEKHGIITFSYKTKIYFGRFK